MIRSRLIGFILVMILIAGIVSISRCGYTREKTAPTVEGQPNAPR